MYLDATHYDSVVSLLAQLGLEPDLEQMEIQPLTAFDDDKKNCTATEVSGGAAAKLVNRAELDRVEVLLAPTATDDDKEEQGVGRSAGRSGASSYLKALAEEVQNRSGGGQSPAARSHKGPPTNTASTGSSRSRTAYSRQQICDTFFGSVSSSNSPAGEPAEPGSSLPLLNRTGTAALEQVLTDYRTSASTVAMESFLNTVGQAAYHLLCSSVSGGAQSTKPAATAARSSHWSSALSERLTLWRSTLEPLVVSFLGFANGTVEEEEESLLITSSMKPAVARAVAQGVDGLIAAVQSDVLPSAYINMQASLAWYRDLSALLTWLNDDCFSRVDSPDVENSINDAVEILAQLLDIVSNAYADELRSIAMTQKVARYAQKLASLKKQWVTTLATSRVALPPLHGLRREGIVAPPPPATLLRLCAAEEEEVIVLFFTRALEPSLVDVAETLMSLQGEEPAATGGSSSSQVEFASQLLSCIEREVQSSLTTQRATQLLDTLPSFVTIQNLLGLMSR